MPTPETAPPTAPPTAPAPGSPPAAAAPLRVQLTDGELKQRIRERWLLDEREGREFASPATEAVLEQYREFTRLAEPWKPQDAPRGRSCGHAETGLPRVCTRCRLRGCGECYRDGTTCAGCGGRMRGLDEAPPPETRNPALRNY